MSEIATGTVRPMRERTAEEIRVMLARRRMSASELARRIGQTQPYLSRRLTGEVALDVDDLERIAEALQVEPAVLLGARIGATSERYPTGPKNPRSGRPRDNRPPSTSIAERRPAIRHRTAAKR